MSTTTDRPATRDETLTPEMVRLLEAGAAHTYGRLVTLRRDGNTHGPALMALAKLGYQRWVGWDPTITEEGRAAIGAPSEHQARDIRLAGYAAEHAALRGGRGAQKPADPHAGNYRAWRTMGLTCILVVRPPLKFPETVAGILTSTCRSARPFRSPRARVNLCWL